MVHRFHPGPEKDSVYRRERARPCAAHVHWIRGQL